MNSSQLCHIFRFSRPAAKRTKRGKVPYTIHPHSGGRFARVASAGFTLVEVLVAMVILLIGIWTLAVAFPKLLGVIGTQEKRTEIGRQAQRTLDQLTRYPNDLPLGIAGDRRLLYDADPTRGPADIDATGKPEDPSISDFAITPPNARDDMIEVIGERFTVSAPPAGGSPTPVYVFRQGLADVTAGITVYRLYPVTEGPDFTIDYDTGLVTTSVAEAIEITYAWVDDLGNEICHVNAEVVGNNESVDAASINNADHRFAGIVEGSVHGVGRSDLSPAVVWPLPSSGAYWLDANGAKVFLHPDDTGLNMGVDYTLLTEPARNGRRALIMTEEHRIVSLPQTITLVASHIDETPLPVDLGGPTTSILAVNVGSGELYWEGNGLELADAAKGEVRLPAASAAASAIGSDLRFYYTTLDQDLISVQIAPATFVDWNIADAVGDDSLLYRSYEAVPNAVDPALTDLLFYPCNAGHTVNVKYKTTGGPNTVTADSGELYTISTEPYPDGHPYQWYHHITLNEPNVDEIIAVTGESLKAIAWWRAPNGRLERLEINTVR